MQPFADSDMSPLMSLLVSSARETWIGQTAADSAGSLFVRLGVAYKRTLEKLY